MCEIGDKNQVVTDCGHIFHASCLMQHVSYNGYGCPYCRKNMVKNNDNNNNDNNNGNNETHNAEPRPIPNIDYIVDYMHRACYSYEDLVRILFMNMYIPYQNCEHDIHLIDGFYQDVRYGFEMYVEPSLPYLDEMDEVDSV